MMQSIFRYQLLSKIATTILNITNTVYEKLTGFKDVTSIRDCRRYRGHEECIKLVTKHNVGAR